MRLLGVVAVMALATSIALVGSGTAGNLLPGWRVSQECTPIAPGDTSGSVGSASLDAGATSTSVFATDNELVLEHGDAGTFRGNVVASPVSGSTVHLDVLGKLNFLVANRVTAPVWFTDPEPLLFGEIGGGAGQFTQVYDVAVDPFDNSIFVLSFGTGGTGKYAVIKYDSAGNYVTEFSSFGSGDGQIGGAAGIAVNPVNGTVAVGDGSNRRVQTFIPNGLRNSYTFDAKLGAAGSGNGQFGSNSPIPLVFDSTGALYAADRGNSRIQKLAVASGSITYGSQVAVAGFPGVGGVGIYDLAMSPANVLYASLVASSASGGEAGTIRPYTTALVAGTDITPAIPAGSAAGIFNMAADSTGLWVNWGTTNFTVHYTIAGSTATEDKRWYSGFPIAPQLNTNYGLAVQSTGQVIVLLKDALGVVTNYGNYRVTSFNWQPVPLSDVIEGYMRDCDSTLGGLSYSYDAAADPSVVLPAWSGDVWTHLKELCTAYQIEIYLDDDTIRVADAGSRTVELRNNTPVRTAPTNLFGGQQVVIAATNARAGGGTVFDASTQNTRFQIDIGQRKTVAVSTTNYPVSVDPVVPTDTLPILPGQYYVIDSTGTHIPASTWLAAGGSVVASVGDSPGQVAFTLQGPAAAISGYTGPFTFADSAASTSVGTLHLTGAGTFTTPQEYTFDTGANPTKTTQQVARTIRNFAIATRQQVFDRAPQAIDDVSGVAVAVSFDMPTADLLGFGATLGAVFDHGDSRYRITNVTFRSLNSTVTAVRFVSLDDIDSATAGLTVDQRDAIWDGYSVDDRTIKPLALTV